MIKISEIPYERPNKEEILQKLQQFKAQFDGAKDVDDFFAVHEQFKVWQEKVSTNFRIVPIRFTQDTRNEFYSNEQDYLDTISPEISVAMAEVSECYLKTPFRKQLEEKLPKVVFVNLQMAVDAHRPEIVEDAVEENRLTTEYSKLLSGITVEFDGQKMPLSKLSKYYTDVDRDVRKQAFVTLGKALDANKEKLDDIYDKLVKVRTSMGKKLGYENYSPLGYLRMQRNCYTKEDIAKFRANVLKYIVPLASKIRKVVGDKLNLGKQFVYDNGIFTEKPPVPTGTPEQLFANASKMYNEMSEEAGKLFDTMVQCECFDVLSREGKCGGGYCEGLPEYKLPFIFANWNGSAGDIDVLTHEFGHALEFYKSFSIDSEFLSSISMETAEVHSMSMEFFAYPWLRLFFGDAVEDYKFTHIGGAITFIPYGTIVDLFQQTCYDNPEMTPQERNAFYKQIEEQFLPYMSMEGIPALEEGRRWQRQSHIYESPFYYIDYCLAQFTALQFLALSRKDYRAAFEKYIKFLDYGGTKTFAELIDACGLLSPFEEESFKQVVEVCEQLLGL